VTAALSLLSTVHDAAYLEGWWRSHRNRHVD